MTATDTGAPGGWRPGGSRRSLVLAGALGVVVLASGGSLLLSGGGDDLSAVAVDPPRPVTTTSPSLAVTPGPAVPSAVPPAVPSAVPPAGQAPPPPVVVPVVHNPFVPLYSDTAVPAAGPLGTRAQAATSPPAAAPDLPAVAPRAPETAAAPTATASGLTPPEASAPYPLKLVRVTGSDKTGWSAGWLVDGVAATAVQGQRFGRDGELVLLRVKATGSVRSAVVQAGTDKPVTVKVGATVRVR